MKPWLCFLVLCVPLTILLLPVLAHAGTSVFPTPNPVSAAADPSTCSTTGPWYQKFYYNTVSNVWKYCSAANTWTSMLSGTGTVTHTNPLTAGFLVLGNGAADTIISGQIQEAGGVLNTGTDTVSTAGLTVTGNDPSKPSAIPDGTCGVGKFLSGAEWYSSTDPGIFKGCNATPAMFDFTYVLNASKGTSGHLVTFASDGIGLSDGGAAPTRTIDVPWYFANNTALNFPASATNALQNAVNGLFEATGTTPYKHFFTANVSGTIASASIEWQQGTDAAVGETHTIQWQVYNETDSAVLFTWTAFAPTAANCPGIASSGHFCYQVNAAPAASLTAGKFYSLQAIASSTWTTTPTLLGHLAVHLKVTSPN